MKPKNLFSVDDFRSLKRRSKYRAVRTVVNEIEFDSKGEAGRYRELLNLQLNEHIRRLQLQRTFEFFTAGVKTDKWRVDFCYEERQADGTWKRVAEDFTGCMTTRKKRMIALFQQQYGVGSDAAFEQWELRISDRRRRATR